MSLAHQFKTLLVAVVSQWRRHMKITRWVSLCVTLVTNSSCCRFLCSSFLSVASDLSLTIMSCHGQRERTYDEFMNYLPPMEIATIHVAMLTLLGDVFYTK